MQQPLLCQNLDKQPNLTSSEPKQNFRNGRWHPSEHNRFVKACLMFGNNWKKVKEFVRTRSSAQIRSHAQKYIIKLLKKHDPKSFKSSLKDENFSASSIFPEEVSENDSLEAEAVEKKILQIFKNMNSNSSSSNFRHIFKGDIFDDSIDENQSPDKSSSNKVNLSLGKMIHKSYHDHTEEILKSLIDSGNSNHKGMPSVLHPNSSALMNMLVSRGNIQSHNLAFNNYASVQSDAQSFAQNFQMGMPIRGLSNQGFNGFNPNNNFFLMNQHPTNEVMMLLNMLNGFHQVPSMQASNHVSATELSNFIDQFISNNKSNGFESQVISSIDKLTNQKSSFNSNNSQADLMKVLSDLNSINKSGSSATIDNQQKEGNSRSPIRKGSNNSTSSKDLPQQSTSIIGHLQKKINESEEAEGLKNLQKMTEILKILSTQTNSPAGLVTDNSSNNAMNLLGSQINTPNSNIPSQTSKNYLTYSNIPFNSSHTSLSQFNLNLNNLNQVKQIEEESQQLNHFLQNSFLKACSPNGVQTKTEEPINEQPAIREEQKPIIDAKQDEVSYVTFSGGARRNPTNYIINDNDTSPGFGCPNILGCEEYNFFQNFFAQTYQNSSEKLQTGDLMHFYHESQPMGQQDLKIPEFPNFLPNLGESYKNPAIPKNQFK